MPVGFAFLLNPAEGLTSIETFNLKSGFLCILYNFVFTQTTVNGSCGPDFGIVPSTTTSLSFSREREKF